MILDAALDLFSTFGYSGTSLKMIADRVNFNPNAIYAHFESKDDLKNCLLKTYGPPALTWEIEKPKLLDLVSEPKKELKNLLDQLASRWLSPKESKVFNFLLMENLRGDTEPGLQIAAMTEKLRRRLLRLFRLLTLVGRLKSYDREWLCSQFLSPIIAVRMEIALSTKPLPLEQIQRRLSRHVDLFMEVFGK